MSCVVRWWDVLFVKGMHFSSKNARLLNLIRDLRDLNAFSPQLFITIWLFQNPN